MDLGALMKIKSSWDAFTKNHPKFPAFLNAVKSQGIHEGTVMEITITNPGCDPLKSNIRITAQDLELFRSLM